MYLSNISFEGKTIVITGGTQGIGFAVATQCVELGGKVVLIGRNKEKAETACEKLGKDRASYYLCDLGSTDSVQKVFERIVTENKVAVYEATKEAVERARAGEGPTFIEAKTYRIEGHFVGDPELYRKREETQQIFRDTDPLKKFREKMAETGLMTVIKLLHTGKEFKDVEHYGLIVKGGNQTLLISGDCELCDEKLRNEIQSEKIDIAIMNFPWVTLRKGRDVITSFIKPKHLIVVHLPFGEDDICGYLPATEKAIKHFDNASDIIVFRNFVQKKAFLTDLKN